MRQPTPPELGILGGLLAAAALLTFMQASEPYTDPTRTAQEFFEAAKHADTAKLRQLCSAEFFAEWERHYSEGARQQKLRIYERLLAFGRPRWDALRSRLRSVAETEYQGIQAQVRTLGQAAFRNLSTSEQMALVDDQARYDDFLFQAGLAALPASSRNLIPDPAAFRSGQDRSAFINQNGWALLSPQEQALAGSARALADENSEEKFALLETFGRESLSAEQQRSFDERLQGATRAELLSPDLYQQKYGENTLRERLKISGLQSATASVLYRVTDFDWRRLGTVPVRQPQGFQFVSDRDGSILRGHEVEYLLQAAYKVGNQETSRMYSLTLRRGSSDGGRSRFLWRVGAASPLP